MVEPQWVTRIVVEATHYDQIREHGGLPGVRDEGVLEAALARPRNKWHYQRTPHLATLAAAYGFGIVANHPFRDGNKRAGFLTMEVFLELNGFVLKVDDTDIVKTMLAVAAGDLSEGQLARWVKKHLVAIT